MMNLKERISSPLEAGLSILDAHHLPPNLTPALEYTSSRLAKKSIHLSLVIVRRDYQLPTIIPPHISPGFCGYSGSVSPPLPSANSAGSRSGAFATSPVASFKSFFRSATRRVSKRLPEELSGGKPAASPGFLSANPLESPRFRWPLTPASPISPPPMTPSTTTSLTSITTAETNGPPTPNPSNLHFLYPSDLSPSTERVMKATISKAGMKFGLGSSWLCPFSSTSARELMDQLYHNSFVQNEALFFSDGLTLLALDRVYSVKSALSSYSKTGSPMRLEDSVDELRRHVLASNGSKISRSDLLRSYDWLNVSNAAAADLDRMYRRAYGGPERSSGLSGMPDEKVPNPPALISSFDDDSTDEEPANNDDDGDRDHENDQHTARVGNEIQTRYEDGSTNQRSDEKRNRAEAQLRNNNGNQYGHDTCTRYEYDNSHTNDDIYDSYLYDQYNDADSDEEAISPSDTILGSKEIGLAITAVQLKKPPAIKRIGPHLKVQTDFALKSRLKAERGVPGPETREEEDDDDDDDDRTARPIERPAHPLNSHFTFNLHSTSNQYLLSGSNANISSNEIHARPNLSYQYRIGNSINRSRILDQGPRPNPLSSHPIVLRTLPSSDRLASKGARVPRVCEDFSPVTRNEWRFLMLDKGPRGRTAAVETC